MNKQQPAIAGTPLRRINDYTNQHLHHSTIAQREAYLTPQVEVIEMETEGAILSASLPGFGDGGNGLG